jgi:hypothetical protein
MPKVDQRSESSSQGKIVTKYRRLGYEVVEHPSADDLPGFMHGVQPDIVARSKADNVVIEVKKSGALKGANELVSIADRILGHPDWRFELVVLDDEENDRSSTSRANFGKAVENARKAISLKLFDLSYIYLCEVLAGIAREVARASGLKVGNKTDRDLFHDLGFRGIIPQEMIEASLTVLSVRNRISHGIDNGPDVSEQDVRGVLDLCEGMRAFL